MSDGGYASAWLREEDLDELNRRLHDGVPVDELRERARWWVTTMFEALFPQATPGPDSQVAEFGPGVGWIVEEILERYRPASVTGLDISEAIARRARERVSDPRATFTVYDGRHLPFPDAAFDVIYSCATIQHIEKHAAFLLMRELQRVLRPRGHAVLHFMSVHFIPREPRTYDEECTNHVEGRPVHWHHYYSLDELFTNFHELLEVDELAIEPIDDYGSFFVHFSKGTGRRFADPRLPELTYPARRAALEPRLRDLARMGSGWARRKVARGR